MCFAKEDQKWTIRHSVIATAITVALPWEKICQEELNHVEHVGTDLKESSMVP